MPVLLAAALIALLPLAAIPLVIHWLTRGRAMPRPFPPLALLARSVAGRARRDRLRERLVLLLRCLAAAALLLAAAGLAWRGGLGGGVPAVVVLDASASMRQVADGATAFDRARGAAAALIDDLAGRPASLLLATRARRGSGPPAPAHGRLRAMLAEAAPAWDDGDPAGALAAATALLPDGGDLLLVTDLSRGSLAGIDPGALPAGIRLTVVDAGGGGANAAVTALSVEPGVLVAGRPAALAAQVANYGGAPLRLRVELSAGSDGAVIDLDLPPGASRPASLSFTPRSPGPLILRAVAVRPPAAADALPEDDQRLGVVEVLPGLAALVAGDGGHDDLHGPLRPLAAALAAGGFTVRRADSAGIAGELAGGAGHPPPALLATAGLAPGIPAAAMRAWLERGGCWLQVVCGDGDAAIRDLAGAAAPVALGAGVDVSAQERGAQHLAAARLEHPLLAAFSGREALLRAVAAFRYRLAAQAPAADAGILLAYADGTPALAERPVGIGRWLQLNCPTSAADGTLAATEALPVLCAQLPAAMLPARASRLADDCGAPRPGAWRDAAGRPAPRDGAGARLDAPGLWRDGDDRPAAAAIPGLESDLRRLDARRLGFTALPGAAAARSLATTPLWPWCLALCLLCLAGEALLMRGLPGRRP